MMARLKIVPALLTALSLSACAGIEPDHENIAWATPTVEGAVGMDVYAARRAQGENVPLYQGDVTIVVITQDDVIAVPGAECILFNDLLSVSFVSPSYVRLPDYGMESPPLTLQCTRGNLVAQTIVQPENVSEARRQTQREAQRSALAGVPFATMIMDAVVATAPRRQEGDIYGYPDDVIIVLRRPRS